MADFYQLLGVSEAASASEIRQAYLRLARDKHPDRFLDAAEKKAAEALFSEITTAFNTLSNPSSRREYDEARQRPQPRGPEEIAQDAFVRGQEQLAAGQIEEAVRLFYTAVHHAPQAAAYHAALGRALAHDPKQAREAVQELEQATRLDPRELTAWLELAVVLARQGLRLRAQRALENARHLAPSDPRVQRLAAELGPRS
jgi:curved DNA-binding protein CbpA